MKYLRIDKAQYEGELKVQLTFNDGVVVLIDFGSWIRSNPHPQYNRYLNEKSFKKFYIDDMGNIHGAKTVTSIFPLTNFMRGISLHNNNIS